MKLVEQRVIDFVAATASKEPTPGGGAIAALTAATGAALAEMVANLTFGKKGYEAVQTEMEALQAKAEEIRNRMLELSQADADVFNIFMNALGLPKNTDEEKTARTAAIQQAYKDAAMVPFEIGELANQIFDLAELASRKGNQNLITDGIIAAINARAAVKSAFLNVRINLSGIKDESFVAELTSKMYAIEKDLDVKESSIIGLYE
ncbi:MAG: cyclodeaminase/cyclohydrolase family protein [Veillonella parvula]|jgi:methenyltetrahydrofolate cyclohydrolase|uniref:cyclodeaminase/cyclohydrolase family protein n=1 Tax=Veillonella parvula TaxID=29466 RepID=UPI00241FF2CE|nr:cyclodeaminase/cyclohydrolase family protein [Veillonella parvula]MBS6139550.1 cyclodeaminase/cyclohydrolase family protein [Veillonella parvula]MDU2141435.1 cyclodeaminase/cyclohydrolase family protein [Veillonella parvula]